MYKKPDRITWETFSYLKDGTKLFLEKTSDTTVSICVMAGKKKWKLFSFYKAPVGGGIMNWERTEKM